MRDCKRDVVAFHHKLGFPTDGEFKTARLDQLITMGHKMLEWSELLLKIAETADETAQLKYTRAHLLMEEAGELMVALGRNDEVEALDGCLDTIYVLVGMGVSYGWPICDGWDAVSDSNLTKQRKDTSDLRCRDKGECYSPPDLEGLLLASKQEEGECARRVK